MSAEEETQGMMPQFREGFDRGGAHGGGEGDCVQSEGPLRSLE